MPQPGPQYGDQKPRIDPQRWLNMLGMMMGMTGGPIGGGGLPRFFGIPKRPGGNVLSPTVPYVKPNINRLNLPGEPVYGGGWAPMGKVRIEDILRYMTEWGPTDAESILKMLQHGGLN